LAAGADGVANRAVLSQRPVVWVGLISYPLYLWHWPLLSFAFLRYGEIPPAAIRLALLGAAVILAWLTYRVIETPVRFGTRGRGVLAALAVAMILVGAAGLGVSRSGGVIGRAVNSNDAARLIHDYDRMHKYGLKAAYHDECDFMDWDTGETRDALPPSCTAAGRRLTLMLWGDSFAQALSLGIRESLPPDVALAQVATSLCPARIDDFEASVDDRCENSDRYAMKTISDVKPQIVILAQSGQHEETDWAKLTARVLELGAQQVLIVGPSPTWEPSLPRAYAEHHMKDRAEFITTGLNDRFRVDRELRARVKDLPRVTYLSLLDHLCHDGACLARIPGTDPLELMAVDFGHLSPKGSAYLGRTVWKPYLQTIIR
jgi:hypothetical protein